MKTKSLASALAQSSTTGPDRGDRLIDRGPQKQIDQFRNLRAPIIFWLSKIENDQTRNAYARGITNGFLRFLMQQGLQAAFLQDLDERVFDDYRSYLKTSLNQASWATQGSLKSPTTQTLQFTHLRVLMETLSKTEEFGKVAYRIRYEFLSSPLHYNSQIYRKPTDRLSNAIVHDIACAALREIKFYRKLAEVRGPRLLKAGMRRLRQQKKLKAADLRKTSVCLALIVERFNGIVPTLDEIRNLDNDLSRSLRYNKLRNLELYLYPTTRQVVPFLILMAIATASNLTPMLRLSKEDLDIEDHLGEKYLVVRTFKARAAAEHIRYVPTVENHDGDLASALAFLLRWNERLLPKGEYGSRRPVFLAKVDRREIGDSISLIPGSGLRFYLDSFCRDRGLPPFGFRQLRESIVDEKFSQTGSVVEAANFARHQAVNTFKYYISDGSIRRQRERIGRAMLIRERFFRTKGRIDPRIRSRHQSKIAATPGFDCIDPMSGPYQKSDTELCSAYGRCPSCPLALADPASVNNVVFYLALRKRLLDLATPSALDWHKVWRPEFEALEKILEKTSKQIHAKAASIMIPIAPLS